MGPSIRRCSSRRPPVAPRWSGPGSRGTVLTVGGENRLRAWSLLAVAVTVTVALFSVGVAIGQATTESSRVAAPPVVGVRTEVAGAVVERTNAADPAPTGHLVVVTVAATSCGVRSVGSGVLVDDDLLVTAAHVVGDAGLVRIDHDGQVLTGEVLGVLADGRDLALIELDASMARPLRSVAPLLPAIRSRSSAIRTTARARCWSAPAPTCPSSRPSCTGANWWRRRCPSHPE